MRQILAFLLAGLCFVAAALSLPLPIPLGIVFFLIGVSLLLIASPAMRQRFYGLRQRYPAMDQRIATVEAYLPLFLSRVLNGGSPSEKDAS